MTRGYRSLHGLISPLALVLELALVGGVLTLSVWAKVPWLTVGALALLGGVVLGGELAVSREWHWRGDILFCWCCTGSAAAGVFLAKVYVLDFYHAVLAWLMAAALLVGSHRALSPAPKAQWRILGLGWAFLGNVVWMGVAYVDNLVGAFHLGILLSAMLLVLCRWWFRPGALGIQIINSLLLLLVALPVADFFFRPSYRSDVYLEPARKLYSYAAAKGDPATFARWCRGFLREWDNMASGIFMPDPAGVIPVCLRPGAKGHLFESSITINQRGLRGQEINVEKGDAYRIIALGESTTFGCTINAGERPWPELLEEMIRQRLHPARRVEVLNAGVPANQLEHCLYRLPRELLPLKPDLLISYHGFNGFTLLRDSMPTMFGEMPPGYRQRPLKLLGDVEYRLRVFFYKRRQTARFQSNPPDLSDPLATRYAQDYHALAHLAETNRICLAVANFSMALNIESPQDVIAFYRTGFPSAFWQVRANLAHTRIVEAVAKEHPDICFIDTHPGLDGDHEKFIDLVHLTQTGREQLAENIFAGLRPLLERELVLGNRETNAASFPNKR